jgi:hypothetical protein
MDHKVIGTKEITSTVIAVSTRLPLDTVEDAIIVLSSKDIIDVIEHEVYFCDDLGYVPASAGAVAEFPDAFGVAERNVAKDVVTDPLTQEYIRRLECAVMAAKQYWSQSESRNLAGYTASRNFGLTLSDVGCLTEDL